MCFSLLLADQARIYYRLARAESLTEWWQWLLVVLACALIGAFVVYMYVRDAVEMSRGVAVVLVTLRMLALLGLLFFFLDLEKGAEQRVTKNSRVVVLVDTSQSMALTDAGEDVPRIEQVIRTLAGPDWMQPLRERHDVVVYRFDEQSQPAEIAAFAKTGDPEYLTLDQAVQAGREHLQVARNTAWIGVAVLILGAASALIALFWRLRGIDVEGAAWPLLGAILSLFVGLVIVAVAQLRFNDFSLLEQLGIRQVDWEQWAHRHATDQESQSPDPEVNWTEQLDPRGVETRLGDAVRWLVNKERGGPIAGIAVLTDGRSNAGSEHELAALAAEDAQISLFPIGIGSDQRPSNVRVADLEAPQRVYPGDNFTIKGYVQSYGWQGRAVRVQLLAGPEPPPGQGAGDLLNLGLEEEQTIALGDDGQTLPVTFQVEPADEGRRRYVLRVIAPEGDFDANDDARSATVEVADTKNRVLLLAGGPTREYRFVRSVMFRDEDVTSSVLLQTAEPGSSQEADEILFEFPRLADELFEYDCIVAFDPDWQQLDDQQMELLERWVSEKGGGLILIAGPVYTPEWTRIRRGVSRGIDILRGLYPVAFIREGAASLALGRTGGDTPWPLQFTRDGLESKFLWLEDDAQDSEATWARFDGVYGYFAVRDRKEGARVYARFSDPQEVSLDNELPIYMAGQYYGAGRVFFMASGELWRLRELNESYLERFYTQVIRWVSEGRLLRDSNRGVLLVDKDRCYLRDQISVTAILTDAQHQPLQAEDVQAVVTAPDGAQQPLSMRAVPDAARAGTFVGFLPAMLEGDYRIELAPPGGASEDLLTREVRVQAPALETEQSTRNDALMHDLAEQTNGRYFIGMAAALQAGPEGLLASLEPRQQVAILPGAIDRDFKQQLMTWLMAFICGALSLEWLLRRLNKLA